MVDVRLRRLALPTDVTGPVYARMESERRRVANELRSLGAAESEKIRADADRQRQVILADAYRQAQKIKGEGDGKASAIYASAYGTNPEFFAFYRSLEAYKTSFRAQRPHGARAVRRVLQLFPAIGLGARRRTASSGKVADRRCGGAPAGLRPARRPARATTSRSD